MIRIRGLAIRVSSIVICILLSLSLFNFSSTVVPQMLENTAAIITNPSNTDQVLQKTRSWTNGEFTNYYGEPEIMAMEYDEKRDVLYLGTTYGLIIYNVTTEEHVLKTAADGLSTNHIRALLLDDRNSILYIGGKGLCLYNIETNTFENKYTTEGLGNNRTVVFALDPIANKLYIGIGTGYTGLSIYNITTGSFSNKRMNKWVTSLALDQENKKLYIGTGGWGMSIYDIETDTFAEKDTTHGLSSDSIETVELDPEDNILYIGTKHKGLSIYNITTDIFVNKNTSHGLPANEITTLSFDSTHNFLYVGTWWAGLSIYNPIDDLFNNKNVTSGLVSNKILSFEPDSLINTLFIGTGFFSPQYNNGLSIYNPETDVFITKTLGDRLPNNHILSIEEQNSTIYIGTNKGLSIYDASFGTFTNKGFEDGLLGYNVAALVGDFSTNRLYIGLHDFDTPPGSGLSIYNITTEIFTSKGTEDGLPSPRIRSLALDSQRNILYIGTDMGGLSIYNITSDSFLNKNTSHGLPAMTIWSLALDSVSNTLYVGTTCGLSIYNITTDTFTHRTTANGLPDNGICELKLDTHDNKLYIGSWDPRLSIYDINTDTFTNIDTGDTMYGDGISGLALDRKNEILYVGTGWDGLYVLDLITQSFIQHLDMKNGLPSKEASPLLWSEDNKKLYIGSVNGLSIYDPYYISPPILDSLPSHDIDGNYTILWSNLSEAKSYILEEHNNITFSSPTVIYEGVNTSYNVTNRAESTYYYRVKAINASSESNWSNIVNINVVFFPNTPILNPLLSPDTDGNYFLSWSTITNAYEYTLEESNNSDFSFPIIICVGSNTTLNITNKPDGISYYRVKATNLAGDSDWSNVVNVTVSIPIDEKYVRYVLPLVVVLIVILFMLSLLIWKERRRKFEEEKDEELMEEEV